MSKRATINEYTVPGTEVMCPFCGEKYRERNPKKKDHSYCPRCKTTHLMETIESGDRTLIYVSLMDDQDEPK